MFNFNLFGWLIISINLATVIVVWLLYTLRLVIKPVRQDDLVANFESSPPAELHPIEIGSLTEYRLTPRDICAELIDLALNSYLSIKKINHTWHLIKLDRDPSSLPNVSRLLMQMLFAQVNDLALPEISESSDYDKQTLNKRIFEKFCHRAYFEHDIMIRFASCANWVRFFVIYVMTLLVTLVFSNLLNIIQLENLSVVLIIIPGVWVATWIPVFYLRRELSLTDKGLEVKRHLLGFKRYLTNLDFTTLQYSGSALEEHQRLMGYLPYVINFQLESKWREFFLDTRDWYPEKEADKYLIYQVCFEAIDAILSQFTMLNEKS
jgi:hypothetical protein